MLERLELICRKNIQQPVARTGVVLMDSASRAYRGSKTRKYLIDKSRYLENDLVFLDGVDHIITSNLVSLRPTLHLVLKSRDSDTAWIEDVDRRHRS